MIRQADDYDSMAIDIEEQSSAQAAQYRAPGQQYQKPGGRQCAGRRDTEAQL